MNRRPCDDEEKNKRKGEALPERLDAIPMPKSRIKVLPCQALKLNSSKTRIEKASDTDEDEKDMCSR